MNPRAIGAIARTTLLEAVRQKFFQFVFLVALAFLLSTLLFRQFNFGSPELKFILDLGFGTVTFFGLLLAVVLSSQMLFVEWESRTAFTILARPLHRHDFLAGKFCGLLVLLAIFTAILVALLSLLVWIREGELMRLYPGSFVRGSPLRYMDIPLFGLLQWLKLGVVAAAAFAVAAFARTHLYTVVVTFLVVVIAQVQYVAGEAYGAGVALPLRLFGFLIMLLFPNFQVFNVGELMMYSETAEFTPVPAMRIVGYGILYMVSYFGLAVFLFRNREM